MSGKPDVRPPVPNHPDAGKRPENGKPHPPVELKDLIAQTSYQVFAERGGNSLLQALQSIDGSLQMHQQDVERGQRNEAPEKFRWRVNPSVAMRLRRERKQIEAELRALADASNAEARSRVAEMYPPEEFIWPEEHLPAEPAPNTETEAAPTAPIPTAA